MRCSTHITYIDSKTVLPLVFVNVLAKPALFAPKLNSILLPQLTDTLNIYLSSVYQLLNVNWCAFVKGILPTLQSHSWKSGTLGGRQLGSGDLVCSH